MNKEVIFKGWSDVIGSWVEGGVLSFEEEYYIVQVPENELPRNYIDWAGQRASTVELWEVVPESLCQYVGFSDSLGTKMFSNDIIAVDNKSYIGVVKRGVYNTDWNAQAGHCGFYIEWQNRSGLRKDLGFWVNQRDIAVIGNVFDGKDLLEG